MTSSEQIFLVRPEYDSNCSPNSSSVQNIEEEDWMSDCSSVDYIVEPVEEVGDQNTDGIMIEISVETNK